MSKQTQALKLALEALEDISSHYMSLPKKGCMALAAIEEALAEQPAITAIREALADSALERIAENERELGLDYMEPVQQQEPVAWQILNGVCHAGIRSTEDMAKEAAADMQKTHDLGGSLAAFHVRPLYTSPPASKPLTDEEIKAMWRRSKIYGTNEEKALALVRAIEAAHGIKENT